MSASAQISVRAIETGVRSVRMRLPFKFGASTLTACPQLFVRAEVDVAGRGTAFGWAAELMVPKWFDKRTELSPADNVAHLAKSVELARDAYVGATPATAFDLFCRNYQPICNAGLDTGLTELSAAYGQAVIDRAVIDAVCTALTLSFFEAMQANVFGLCATPLVDDMRGWDWNRWLAQLHPLRRIEFRHTIGLLDEIESARFADDGLPATLPAVIERYGHRFFKIKLGGDPMRDVERLRTVLAVARREATEVRYTLDANEQYADLAALRELLRDLHDLPPPLYIEQPLPRELSLLPTLKALKSPAPLLMDEADGTLDAFVRGRDLGWSGVSSKGCKGIYKALVNRARCERWNREQGLPRYFMSAEDLTCQAGICLQQDVALAALLGLTHSERNGHHYGDGLASAPAEERRAFTTAHSDLYDSAGRVHLRAGAVSIDSLFGAGFAHRAEPDLSTLQPLANAAAWL
jgi:hypothetical protein